MSQLHTELDEEEIALSEIVKADIQRVDGVLGPANGLPFLLIKAAGDQPEMVKCPTCDGSGKILAGNRKCPDCGGTGKVSPDKAQDLKKAMSTADINDLPDSSFAHIEPGGKKDSEGKTVPRTNRHYPVHDKVHADAAAAYASKEIKAGGDAAAIARKAMPKIEAAQKKFGEDGDAKKGVDEQPSEGAVAKDIEVDVEVVKPACEMPEVCDPMPMDAEVAPMSPASLFEGDGEIQLQGDEAMHNVPLNNAIASIKQLMTQEIGEPTDESWDVDSLNCVLRMLYAWAQGEQWEGEQDIVSGALGKAGARLSAASTSAIQAALKHLQGLLDGPQAKGSADTTSSDGETADDDSDTGDAKKAAAATKEAPVADTQKEAAVAAATEETVAKATAPESTDEKPEQPVTKAGPDTKPAKGDKSKNDDDVDDDTNDSEEEAKKAAATQPTMNLDELRKSIVADMGEVLKSAVAEVVTAAVKPLEDRLVKVEEQPIPNGPFLNGRAQDTADYLIVRKGQGQAVVQNTPDELMKALGDAALQPKDRERIGRILAENAHPFHPRAAQ